MAVCSSLAINPPSVDPLMLLDFARTMPKSVVPEALLAVCIALSAVAISLNLSLSIPVVFHWRHAQNVHFLCIGASGGTAFFLLILGMVTTSAISGAIAALNIVSLQVVFTERGVLLEGFVWAAFGLWFFIFLYMWWIRWWQILEVRQLKRAG
jgi:hypothetical protein